MLHENVFTKRKSCTSAKQNISYGFSIDAKRLDGNKMHVPIATHWLMLKELYGMKLADNRFENLIQVSVVD